MPHTDELLDGIRRFEAAENNLSGIDLNNTYINKTADNTINMVIPPGLASKTFKPDKSMPIFLISAMLLFGAGIVTASLRSKPPSTEGAVLGVCFAGLCILSYITKDLQNTRLRYTITISPEGIAYNDDLYNWDSIQETALLHLPKEKTGRTYLVLVFKNDRGHDTWDITFFTGLKFPGNLCTYIEYFKALKANN
jgi:hypothetical protein